ncbi:zinc knuckle CX2CX4HX4C containing protein [Tanacetum coccineum]
MQKGFLDSGERGSNHKKKDVGKVDTGSNMQHENLGDVLSSLGGLTIEEANASGNKDSQEGNAGAVFCYCCSEQTNVQNGSNYDVWLPLDSVHEVNDRMKNSLYEYFIGKRLAFLVVEWCVRNKWEKYGLEKVKLVKGFFFSKLAYIEGGEYVLYNCLWMIRGIPILLNKWSSSVSLLKEELSYVPVWVKFHDVLLVAYTSDGSSLMATKMIIQ